MGRTNIELDDDLLKAGFKMTQCKIKKELVNKALKDLVSRKKRKKILEIEGKIDWVGSLDEMRKGRK